tara:strand:- start:3655 stop:5166 length:1512 start_codon:yes stop_codon:yes gene_type:complete
MINFSLIKAILIFRRINNINKNANKKIILMPNEQSLSEVLSILPLYLSVANAGYRIKIYLSIRNIRTIFYYLLIGINSFYFLSTKSFCKKKNIINEPKLNINKSINATLMRHYKVESIDSVPEEAKSKLLITCREILNGIVKQNFKNIYGVFFTDYHYIPQGVIKSYLEKYIPTINLFDYHVGHKNSTLIINLLNKGTLARHPFSPPINEFLNEIKNISKKDSEIKVKKIQDELLSLYKQSSWYEVSRTSSFINIFNRSKEELLKDIQFKKNKKIFAIFPHIYFDTSAFSGKDLYKDYKDWFEKTTKFILENTDSYIIIKDHPANLQKYAYDSQVYKSPIKSYLNKLNKNYRKRYLYLSPKTEISALNIINISNCILTVRGTIGVEAALFGKPVIFAGEGRYNGYGFGFFPKNIRAYHKLLLDFSRIDKQLSYLEKLNAASYLEILWERMTYYSKIISVSYPKNPNKKIFTSINTLNIKRTLDEIKGLSEWLKDPKECYLSKN